MVSLSIKCLKQTLRIIVLQHIFILTLTPISLPFNIYYITYIVFIIVALFHLLLLLVLNQELTVPLISFSVINHVITVPTLMIWHLTSTFIVSLALPLSVTILIIRVMIIILIKLIMLNSSSIRLVTMLNSSLIISVIMANSNLIMSVIMANRSLIISVIMANSTLIISVIMLKSSLIILVIMAKSGLIISVIMGNSSLIISVIMANISLIISVIMIKSRILNISLTLSLSVIMFNRSFSFFILTFTITLSICIRCRFHLPSSSLSVGRQLDCNHYSFNLANCLFFLFKLYIFFVVTVFNILCFWSCYSSNSRWYFCSFLLLLFEILIKPNDSIPLIKRSKLTPKTILPSLLHNLFFNLLPTSTLRQPPLS